MSDPYARAPKPRKRCENCAHARPHINRLGEDEWDVKRCSLDGKLKDYRVTCERYARAGQRGLSHDAIHRAS